MIQDTIVDALGKHMDALQTIFDSIIVLAVAIAWAGVSRQSEIEALGIKFQRRYAFFVASGLYLVANIAVFILFFRISNLFTLLDHSHVVPGFSVLATHSWVLNPFSFFGGGLMPRLISAWGIGLLIFLWWVCGASLLTFEDKAHAFAAKVIRGSFQVVGLLSIWAVCTVMQGFIIRGENIGLIGEEFRSTMFDRLAGALLGFGAGALAVKAIKRGYERWTDERG